VAVSAADPSVAVAWRDLPATISAEPAEVGSTAANGKTALQEAPSAMQKEGIVFLQRPGVHIRSAPSTNGRVLATVPKGTRFKVTNHEGDWVQVENDRFSGWIRSRFLAANEP
jgi:SH3-like domain-containing protein